MIAAASYEARRYGVRSAMPSTTAKRLCPDAVFLPGDHALYATVSADVHEIFTSFTPLVEPLSLDEAFLDVSGGLRLHGPGTAIAHRIRDRVWDELQLRCSVGVAPNKFLAKLASVAAKPIATAEGVRDGQGVVEVLPGNELPFLHPLPVSSAVGCGAGDAAASAAPRRAHGRRSRRARRGDADRLRGRRARQHLYRLAWGLDDRPVEVDREMKSIGHEETFATDRHDHAELLRELVRLSDAVAARLRGHGVAARTLTLKVRFAGFETITRSVTVAGGVSTSHAIVAAVEPLLEAIDPSPGVRLLGVSASNFTTQSQQLSLDDLLEDRLDDDHQWQLAEETIDAIRKRFGTAAIGPASAVGDRGLRLVHRGAQQWGPDEPTHA